jgi:hypothetical protein
MEIKGKIHCFFEQSGTFKNEFKKLGYDALDYDIQNSFGETDYVVDFFNEIENGYDNKPSMFDNITSDDLVMAFFPCIYFCCLSQVAFSWGYRNYKKLSYKERTEEILKRSKNREKFYSLAIKMLAIAKDRGIRLIMENPFSEQTYLRANFVISPTFIDKDRSIRGDFYKKPTAYYYINCEPTNGMSFQKDKVLKRIVDQRQGRGGGLCSEERSMISPDYARNFIYDFIIGKKQNITQLTLF